MQSLHIETEPIGSVPRPEGAFDADAAVLETLRAFEATGSPVITDGEQSKPSFVGYPLAGLSNLAGDGVRIPFVDGHVRQLPVLTAGPFRFARYAADYLRHAKQLTSAQLKQLRVFFVAAAQALLPAAGNRAVIAASALSLIYPATPLPDYSREAFLNDLVSECVKDIRQCLEAGAHVVQIDFTEGRLSVKLDPSLGLLRQFVQLNNRVLDHFSDAERLRIGVHTCPGGDKDSTHSADVPYSQLIPDLMQMKCGRFYFQLASEKDPAAVLALIKQHVQPHQKIFVGVIDVLSPHAETAEQVADFVVRVVRDSQFPVGQLGTCDDCGFSPFADDTSTSRELAFQKIAARVQGTKLAEKALAQPH